MAKVTITPEALKQFADLPKPIQHRMRNAAARLAAWPEVSGAKPLHGELTGNYRIRTGDYRLIFKVVGDDVIIWKFGYRKGMYD